MSEYLLDTIYNMAGNYGLESNERHIIPVISGDGGILTNTATVGFILGKGLEELGQK